MKLTKQTLKQIIKEELKAVMEEEELDEGMRDLFFGGALALGGLAGAGKAYDTFNPSQDNIEQVDDFSGPLDTRTDIQKSRSDIDMYRQAAEEAAKRGDFETAEKNLNKLHHHMKLLKVKAEFMSGDFDAAKSVKYDEVGKVQQDLDLLKSRYQEYVP
jgi:hypothetical protein